MSLGKVLTVAAVATGVVVVNQLITRSWVSKKIHKEIDSAEDFQTDIEVSIMSDISANAMQSLASALKAEGLSVGSYGNAEMPCEFQMSWHNGTGYFDGAVKHKFEGDVPQVLIYCTNDARWLVIVPREEKNYVLFQRYSNSVRWQEMSGSADLTCLDIPEFVRRIKNAVACE